ncbi:MAG TPA: tRNA lysidine(34) synthetase TilS [Gemmataceae bacterium]|nr:tRNA lysidine(34) synthetase TilS [Gemmataceae bacterium]
MADSGQRTADSGRRLVGMVRKCLRSRADAAAGVVVAVSGGADSVALLLALDAARDPRAPMPLVLAHLNHQLRGSESDGDEAFVAELHARLTAAGRPCLSLYRARLDIASQARAERENLEALARRERYRWLAEVARSHGLSWIVTGHTANDQAETVLHRLLRGTGLRGLRGIAARRELEPGLTLIRPLLTATRTEIVAYLQELAQPYRQDSTNRELAYTRNRIRHELLPHLAASYNPAIVGVLARLAEQADAAYCIEEAAALALLSEAELPRAGVLLIFDRARLLTAPRHRVREMFRAVWAREGWPLSGMDHAAWERLADVVFAGSPAVDLPGCLHARRVDRVVQVGAAYR